MEVLDDAARRRIRTGVKSGVFVEAGAGSGKTTELTNRVVHLVTKEGVAITSIVAITYTKAAAGEMRGRIREALSNAHSKAKGSTRHALTRAIEDLPLTPIQTIHAFAEKILRRYGHAVGVPSTFEVLNPVLMQSLLQEDWNRRLDNLSETAEASLLKPLSVVLGADLRTNRTVLPALAGVREVHASWPDADVFVAELHSRWRRVREEFALYSEDVAACEDSFEPVVVFAGRFFGLFGDRLRESSETLPSVSLAMECLEWLGTQKQSDLGVGPVAKKHWGNMRKARQAAYGVRDALTEVVSLARGHLAELYLAEMSECVQAVRAARRASGQLGFDELVFLLGELVEIPRIASELQDKYPYLIIDEFQDTDGTQTQLVSRLTRELDTSRRSQLFVVGDPKQAIYGFRGADLAQYEAVGEQWLGDRAELTMNFRSQPAVMDWVNATFSSLEASQGRGWLSLQPGRPDRGGFVRTFGKAVPGGKSAEVRSEEAADTVARIASAMAEGLRVDVGTKNPTNDVEAADDDGAGPHVSGEGHRASDGLDPGREPGSRPLRYGDVAVLVSRRSSLPSLERELRLAGIPYRLELGSGVWRTDEAAVVVSAFRVILDETDENSVVALLRSAMFACSDAELLQWKQGGGTWRLNKPIPQGLQEGRVASAYRMMQSWAARRNWESPLALLDRIIQDSQWQFAALSGGRPREFWNRLRYVRAHVVAYVQSGARSLDEVVDWMASSQESESDAKETPVAESDEDAVRVMTMHAAKGLEFPAVFVIGGASLRFKQASEGVLEHEGGIACSFGGDIATESWGAAAAQKKAREVEEALRLLYVATTRARDYLWVSFWRKTSRSTNSKAEPLPITRLDEHRPNGTEDEVELQKVDDSGRLRATEVRVGGEQVPEGPWLAESQDRDRVVAQLVEVAARPRWLSATARARMLRENAEVSGTKVLERVEMPDEQVFGDTERDEAGAIRTAGVVGDAANETSEAMRFGLAVHLALEWVLDRGRDVESASALAAKHLAVEPEVERVEKSVTLAMGSPLIARARAAEVLLCEVPIRSPESDGLVVGGTVDLLFLEAGQWHVVDYKTDHVSLETLASRVAGYAPQLQTYGEALTACGLAIGSASLLFVSPEMEAAITETVSVREMSPR